MTIKTDYSKTFSYARMQNGVRAVRSIIIKNPEHEALKDVRLTIKFDPSLSEGYTTVISEIPSKGKVILDDINILPSASFLANLTETVQGTMKVILEAESQEESQTHFSQHFSQLQFDTMIAKAAFRCNAAKLLQKIDTMSENNIYFNFREQLSCEG